MASSGELSLVRKGIEDHFYTTKNASSLFTNNPLTHTPFYQKTINIIPKTQNFQLLKKKEQILEFEINHVDSRNFGDLIKDVYFNLRNISYFRNKH